MTLHRPSNVDDFSTLPPLVEALIEIARDLPLVFPVHPRTWARMEACWLRSDLDAAPFLLTQPLAYPENLGLMANARLVLTESGGIQEEATALGVPCLTLRGNTERPVTVAEGTNSVVGANRENIVAAAREGLATGGKRERIPELWDAHASERIARILREWFDGNKAR